MKSTKGEREEIEMSDQPDLTLPITALTPKAEDKGNPRIAAFTITQALGLFFFFHWHILHALRFIALSQGEVKAN